MTDIRRIRRLGMRRKWQGDCRRHLCHSVYSYQLTVNSRKQQFFVAVDAAATNRFLSHLQHMADVKVRMRCRAHNRALVHHSSIDMICDLASEWVTFWATILSLFLRIGAN